MLIMLHNIINSSVDSRQRLELNGEDKIKVDNQESVDTQIAVHGTKLSTQPCLMRLFKSFTFLLKELRVNVLLLIS